MPADGYICTAGLEGIIPLLIIVFVVVSQIRKAMRKGQPPLSDESSPDNAGTSPEDELRNFLRSLQETTGQTPTPPRSSPPPASATPPPRPAPSAKRPPPLPVARVQPTPAPRPSPPPLMRQRVPSAIQNLYTPADQWRVKRQAAAKKKEERRRPPPPRAVVPVVALESRPVLPPPDSGEIRDIISGDPYAAGEKPRDTASVQRLRLSLAADLISRGSLRKAILLSEVLGRPLALRGSQAKGFQQ